MGEYDGKLVWTFFIKVHGTTELLGKRCDWVQFSKNYLFRNSWEYCRGNELGVLPYARFCLYKTLFARTHRAIATLTVLELPELRAYFHALIFALCMGTCECTFRISLCLYIFTPCNPVSQKIGVNDDLVLWFELGRALLIWCLHKARNNTLLFKQSIPILYALSADSDSEQTCPFKYR